MNASLALHEFRRRGVTVWAEAGRLRFRGPTAEVTAGVVEIAQGCKAELMTILNAGPDPKLVHIAADLVHPDPGFGPHSGESGPGQWTNLTDATPEDEPRKGREGERNSEIGPLGPPYCPDIYPAHQGKRAHREEGQEPSEEGARGFGLCNPTPILTESGPGGPSGPHTHSGFPDLADRWGPSLDHDEPSIDIPAGCWRQRVARLPHERWVAWRNRSSEILEALGHAPTAEEIVAADRQAAAEMDIPGAGEPPAQVTEVLRFIAPTAPATETELIDPYDRPPATVAVVDREPDLGDLEAADVVIGRKLSAAIAKDPVMRQIFDLLVDRVATHPTVPFKIGNLVVGSTSRPSSGALRYLAAFLSQGWAARSEVVSKAADSGIPEADIEAAAGALDVERSDSAGVETWRIT